MILNCMSDDRVEPRVSRTGRGLGAMPEDIERIGKRRRAFLRASAPKPTRDFSSLLEVRDEDHSSSDGRPAEDQVQTDPVPRPGMVHPAQRYVFGRENGRGDPVVLKG